MSGDLVGHSVGAISSCTKGWANELRRPVCVVCVFRFSPRPSAWCVRQSGLSRRSLVVRVSVVCGVDPVRYHVQ